MIYPDLPHGVAAVAQRKLRYNFEDLAGIEFGTRTSEHDMIRIMKIVEAKCKQTDRKDFEFSRMKYSDKLGSLEAVPMKLLEFA